MLSKSARIYQVEVTNWCNATCTYCPQPTHAREKGYLAADTLREVLRVTTEKELLLHHFGEPLLHKGLEELVALCRTYDVTPGISTNGKTLTQKRLDALAAAGLGWLRLHTDPFGVRLRDFTVPAGLEMTEHRLLVKSDAPKKELQDFAGHLDLPGSSLVRKGFARCSFLKAPWRVVLWDGRMALCCNDVEGVDATSLCKSCDGYVFTGPRDNGSYDGEPKT